MPIVVETGEGLPDAESYVSVAAFRAYCDARGLSYGAATDEQIERALRRATAYLEGRLRGNSKGQRRTAGQALTWPRYGVVDQDGFQVPYDQVPKALAEATAEAAQRELSKPGSLSPDFVAANAVKRKVVGPVEKEFFAGGNASDVRPVVAVIDALVAGLLRASGGGLSATAVRA